MKVLGVIRLSRETDESTSPQRQRETITRWAEANGHQVIGWAEDLGVSASVDPWQRPQLGPWLRGEREPFDVLAAWRVDRLARRVLHFARLLEWARDNGKDIVSATEGFDLSTPLGRMFAQMIAMLAEGELEAIRERAKGSYDHLVKIGRWRGGFVPYGYRPERTENGWRLVIDDEAAEVVRGIVRDVMSGQAINQICARLNRDGVPAPLDHQRIRAGKPPKGALWRVSNLRRMLRGETLLGYMSPDDGREIVDDTGRRVRRAEPILSLEEWQALQAELDSRGSSDKPRPRVNSAMLRRVAFCGLCDRPMYVMKGGNGRPYYRCAAKALAIPCENRAIRAEDLEAFVADTLLTAVGDVEVYRKVFVPGTSHEPARKEIREALARLADRLARVPDGPAAEAVLAAMQSHSDELKRLESLPDRPDEWREEPTGETFADLWSRLDTLGRGNLLREYGVRVSVTDGLAVVNLGQLESLRERAKRAGS